MSDNVIDLATLSPTQGFVMQEGRRYAGLSVSTAGDINADGFADVIVGAPRSSGQASVLFGRAGGFGDLVDGRQVVDLSAMTSHQGFAIWGGNLQRAGGSVSAAGDVNHDGIDDLLVGAIFGGDYPPPGEAYVLFGRTDDFGEDTGGRQVVRLSTFSGTQGFVIQGDTPGGWAGHSVSEAGDVNGDGFDDVIVGAPYGYSSGAAYVVFGAAGSFGEEVDGRQVVDLATLSSSQGFVIRGAENYDRAGFAVSDAGDVNGDGFADLIIAAPVFVPYGSGGTPHAGGQYVLFGGADGFGRDVGGRQVVDLATLTPARGFIIQGAMATAGAGYSVSAAGDINGDGLDDIIVGGPGGDDGGDYTGEAYVVFGSPEGPGTTIGGRQVLDLTKLTPADGFVMRGAMAGDTTGTSVSAAGDVNGDGFGDVIIGAPRADRGSEHAGEAYIVFGGPDGFGTTVGGRQVVDLAALTPDQGLTIRGDPETPQGLWAGYSVSAAGDIDGDGFDDVIVGAPFPAGGISGEAYVIFGDNFSHAVANVGTDGDDRINSGPSGQTIFGAQGNDTLFGNGGADSLNGCFGDDRLNGGADADVLVGGSGADRLNGDAGNDTEHGDAGSDSITGGYGNDRLDGGTGADSMHGGAGNDTFVVDNASDVTTEFAAQGIDTVLSSVTRTLGNVNIDNLTLTGGAAINGTGNALGNVITGNAAANALSGLLGDDTITGGGGGDTLGGGAGNDVLRGGDGSDVLVGGAGRDVLVGGSNSDRFVFGSGSWSIASPDTITDFLHGFDTLVIRSGTDHGSFLGGGAFTGGGGIEVRWDARTHQLQVDLNGDGTLGTGELAIEGGTLATLTAHDLLFV